jgi:hypothetical protein
MEEIGLNLMSSPVGWVAAIGVPIAAIGFAITVYTHSGWSAPMRTVVVSALVVVA